MKQCSKCKEIKLLKEFSKRNASKDKHDYWCKPCRQWRNNNDPKQNKEGGNPLNLTREEKMKLPVWFVYEHVDFDTGEIVYRGKGCEGRSNDALLRRKPDHAEWCLEQLMKKRDYVIFAAKFVDGYEALRLEKKLNDECKPKFNR